MLLTWFIASTYDPISDANVSKSIFPAVGLSAEYSIHIQKWLDISMRLDIK